MITKKTKSNLTDKEKEILKAMDEAMERQSKIPESEKILLDSPKFTKYAIGIGDDGKPFTDEEVKRNHEILYGKVDD